MLVPKSGTRELSLWICILIPFLAGCDDNETNGTLEDAGADSPNSDIEPTQSEYCPVREYEACGGELVGQWSLKALCPDDPVAAAALCESPLDAEPECNGGANQELCLPEIEGTFEFTADGQVTFDVSIYNVITWVYTDRCLEAAEVTGSSPAERCATLANEFVTCEYTPDACSCRTVPIGEPEEGTGSYTVTDNEIAIGEDPPSTFCVDGNSLILDYYLYHPVSWRYWVFERL